MTLYAHRESADHMKGRKGSSPKKGSRGKGKRFYSHKRPAPKKAAQTQKLRRLTARQLDEKVRCLAAINRYRRGEAKSVSAAARAEGTTVKAIRTLVPATITQKRPGGRIRVKASDQYSAKVQILTNEGALSVTARGSRQRELAGRHRATVLRVLQGKEPQSALEQYRGKKVGGHELISDYGQLSSFARAGILGQLDNSTRFM
jgi:hypothetical protein